MIDQTTIKMLREMKLPGMANELEAQMENPANYKDLSFEARMGMLADAEMASRKKNTIQRRIRNAHFSIPQASVESIEYLEDRNLDKAQIMNLATCAYIRDNHHIVIKGATGAGKSYISNALGIAACRKLFKVRYVRLPDLLNEYAVAKSTGSQNKVKATYSKFDLLIIDEWLLRPIPESEAYDLLEIIDICSGKGALIICTQYDTDDWYYRIDCDRGENESSAVAEAILDRIINNKYVIDVKGQESMRKRHGFSGKAESDEKVI